MKLNLSLDYIISTTSNFLNDNKNIAIYKDVRDMPGKEHYFLLASIGVQLKNSKIIELGTHKGNSVIALNYGNKINNNNNEIYTYDIMNCLDNVNKFLNTNIIYRLENLFDNACREENKEHILSSDMIFIDIDPHEGILEYDMYLWLKNNNYKGLILFDDVHLGVGHKDSTSGNSMQQFWDKIEDCYKIDITNIGHWSGSGLISFCWENNEITL